MHTSASYGSVSEEVGQRIREIAERQLDRLDELVPMLQAAVVRAAPALGEPRYVFVPHPTEGHPQYEDGEMTYGEAVISLPYVRERWSELFDLVDVHAFPEDIYQVAVTLKKRS